MVALPETTVGPQTGHRLVSSQYPPIDLFDDVASAEDFNALYALQARTNPRLRNEVGNLNLLPPNKIPWGIPGCSYAVAPFTHVHPDGSRFGNGSFGVLYLADEPATAVAEVRHHQQIIWSNVKGLHDDRLVMRGLHCEWGPSTGRDATGLDQGHPIYDPDSYTASQALGLSLRQDSVPFIQYLSVRQPGATCWGLFTPRPVTQIVQTAHYQFVLKQNRIVDVQSIHSL